MAFSFLVLTLHYVVVPFQDKSMFILLLILMVLMWSLSLSVSQVWLCLLLSMIMRPVQKMISVSGKARSFKSSTARKSKTWNIKYDQNGKLAHYLFKAPLRLFSSLGNRIPNTPLQLFSAVQEQFLCETEKQSLCNYLNKWCFNYIFKFKKTWSHEEIELFYMVTISWKFVQCDLYRKWLF